MIRRTYWLDEVAPRLSESAAVALLGPRQVGKTTLARQVAEARNLAHPRPSQAITLPGPLHLATRRPRITIG